MKRSAGIECIGNMRRQIGVVYQQEVGERS